MVKLPEKWPYWPPENFDLIPLSAHWRPADHILLSEAVDLIGREVFGPEWSGQELKARQLSTVHSPPPQQTEDPGPFQDPSPSPIYPAGIDRISSSSPAPGGWRVITAKGNRYLDSEDKAVALWKQEQPKLLEMWREEKAARARHVAIVRKLRTDLNAGTLHAWAHRTKAGDLTEIPLHIWGRDGITSVFELGNDRQKWLNPNMIEFCLPTVSYDSIRVEGRVLLKRSEVERYIATAPDTVPPPHRSRDRIEYTPPYLAFMLRATRALGLKDGIRTPKEIIEGWLRENWPDHLGTPTNRKTESMATFLRHPEDERGGYFKPNRDE